jgi:prepilin-type N-terminal cleavage/methylation domain-containing protein
MTIAARQHWGLRISGGGLNWGPMPVDSAICHRPSATRLRRGFTLIELMVAIGILLVLGIMIIGFLRGALTMSRTGAARGKAYETAQTTLRLLQNDLDQVIAKPPHPDGPIADLSFSIQQDPWGRQFLCLTRAWGEEQSSLAGYDSGRAAPGQRLLDRNRVSQGDYSGVFRGRNVRDTMRPSGGNLEVVWMMEPSGTGMRLYRAERSPPQDPGGLISAILDWAGTRRPANPAQVLAPDDLVPGAYLREYGLDGQLARPGLNPSIWSHFELVADDVVCLSFECWDDWQGRTQTWLAGRDGPVHAWGLRSRLLAGQYPLPSALRVTLIVAADDPIRAQSPMVGELSRFDTSVMLESTDNFPDVASPMAYARINGEIMAYASKTGSMLGSMGRGALGTRATDHARGAVAVSGIGFQRVVQLPVSR